MRSLKRMAAVLIIAAAVAGSAFAFDLSTFPSPISKGSLLVSPGFALAKFYLPSGLWGDSYGKVSFGGTVGLDYALPINFALTAGAESGLIFSPAEDVGDDDGSALMIIPIVGRVAWHPNFEVNNLDVYVMLKAGWALGIWTEKPEGVKNPGGFVYGFDLGFRYFFTGSFGAFIEGGWDNYYLKYKVDTGWGEWSIGAYARKFLTAGVTFKVGGK